MQPLQAADEISVDIVGVIFVFGKGAVGVDFANTDRPELAGQYFEAMTSCAPHGRIPLTLWNSAPGDQDRLPKVVERDFVVPRRQEGRRNRNPGS